MGLLRFLLFALLPACSLGGRILLLAVAGRSHVQYLATAGKELATRGHEVHIVLPTSSEKLIKDFSKLINPSLTIHHPEKVEGVEDPMEREEDLVDLFKSILYWMHTLKIPNTFLMKLGDFTISNTLCETF